MGFLKAVTDFISLPDASGIERKSGTIVTTQVPQLSANVVEAMLLDGYMDAPRAFRVSAVMACARVIAEGLALPPCYLHQEAGGGKTLATKHPLYSLLNKSPNERQTSYEFREMLGYQLALNGNAFVFVNRSRRTGEVLELLPCDPGSVSINVDASSLFNPLQYTLYGQVVPTANVWHLKGPAWFSWRGMDTLAEARDAIGLASATQTYGAKLFTNAARPGALISPKEGVLEPAQFDKIKEQLLQYQGAHNAHKTMVLSGALSVEKLSSDANEAQWTESRRFQIEEICRFFRVSPIKVFQQIGSQSYASVEQAHIAHDQDTDAHWQERFVQSANKALLTDAERGSGLCVTIDNRSILRGTAAERMKYYTAGIAAGIMTRNEAREMEGFDRSSDPEADKLTPAQNLFGRQAPGDAAMTQGGDA